LDSLGGIWTFQCVTANPNKKILSFSWAGSKCLKRMPPSLLRQYEARLGFGRQENDSKALDCHKENAEAGSAR
jgi:hypothetical protein